MSRLSRLNLHPPAVVVRVAALRLVVHRQVAEVVLALVEVRVAAVKAAAQFLQLPEEHRLPHLPVVAVAVRREARQFRRLRAPLQQRRARAVAAAEHLLL